MSEFCLLWMKLSPTCKDLKKNSIVWEFFPFSFFPFSFFSFDNKGWVLSSLFCCCLWTWTNCSNFIGKRKFRCWFSNWGFFLVLFLMFFFCAHLFFYFEFFFLMLRLEQLLFFLLLNLDMIKLFKFYWQMEQMLIFNVRFSFS